MGATLLRAWSAPSLVARVEIDAGARTVVAAENAEVSGLEAAEGGISWTEVDRALPLPLSYDDATVELAQRAGADLESLDDQRLVVTGLSPGRYALRVDGQRIETFDAEALARGLNLARYGTPMRGQAFPVAWSAAEGHDLQKLRRSLLVAAEKEPSLKATTDILAARDEAEQKARSEAALPKPRRFELGPAQ
jgi:hypothetical protein